MLNNIVEILPASSDERMAKWYRVSSSGTVTVMRCSVPGGPGDGSPGT